jgi:hypothetical protein
MYYPCQLWMKVMRSFLATARSALCAVCLELRVDSLDTDANTVTVECADDSLTLGVRNPDVAAVNAAVGSILVGSEVWACLNRDDPASGFSPFYRKAIGVCLPRCPRPGVVARRRSPLFL